VVYSSFQEKFQHLNLQLRTNPSKVIELYEDQKHGMHANVGIFSLEKEGDVANFCFLQDNEKINSKLNQKVQEKIQEKADQGFRADADRIYQNVLQSHVIGSIVHLQQEGKVRIYFSDVHSKPGPKACKLVFDTRQNIRKDLPSRDVKIKFAPTIKAKRGMMLGSITSSDGEDRGQERRAVSWEDEDGTVLGGSRYSFNKIDSSLAFFDNMGKEVRDLARKSIETMPLLSQRLNRLYVDGGDKEDFEQMLNPHRYVNMTVEALRDNCQGRIVCRSEIFVKKKGDQTYGKTTSNKGALVKRSSVPASHR